MIVWLWAVCAGPGAAPVSCADPRLQVESDETVSADLACEGGHRAIGFLTGLGLSVPPGLVIEVVAALPELYGAGQLGSFDADTGRIRVLAYPQCEQVARTNPVFGMAMDEDLYRGIVAHEVAHAFFAANHNAKGRVIVAQEYIAYTTQFMAMSPALRARILAASQTRAFDNEDSMSELYYFLDPHAFAIAAFRHFRAQPDPAGFIWRLLRGEVRTSSWLDHRDIAAFDGRRDAGSAGA